MLIHSATACSQSLEDVVDAGEIPRSAKAKCWGSFTYNVCRGERGGIPKAEKSIDKLCECDGDKGGEVTRIKKKNAELPYCTSFLSQIHEILNNAKKVKTHQGEL